MKRSGMADAGPVGVLSTPGSWGIDTDWATTVVAAASALDLEARRVTTAEDVAATRTLLVVGKLTPAIDSMLAVPGPRRRILWTGEPLLAPDESRVPLERRLATSAFLERHRARLRPLVRRLPLPGALGGMRDASRAERERTVNLRRIVAAAPQFERIVVTHRSAAAALAARGLRSNVVPFGYEPAVHGEMTAPDAGDRDLAIVMLGQRGRRAAWRRSVVDAWQRRDPGVVQVSGVWGDERNAVLRRARVVLNVQRVPGTFAGYRLVLALAAGAVVVGEPMTDPHPFVPGVHYVEAPLHGLVGAARELLEDEPRRRRIADAGQALLREAVSMRDALPLVLGP